MACPLTRIWAGEREVCDGEELWRQGISKLPATQQGPKCLCLLICKLVWEDAGGECVASGTEIPGEVRLDQLSAGRSAFYLDGCTRPDSTSLVCGQEQKQGLLWSSFLISGVRRGWAHWSPRSLPTPNTENQRNTFTVTHLARKTGPSPL